MAEAYPTKPPLVSRAADGSLYIRDWTPPEMHDWHNIETLIHPTDGLTRWVDGVKIIDKNVIVLPPTDHPGGTDK